VGDNGDPTNICQFPNPERAKGTLYQNGVHVPLLISGPAVVNPNRSSAALVSVADLFATLLELSGTPDWATMIPADRPVDAVSLMPILKAQETDVRNWVFTELFTPTPTTDDGKTIRDKQYKLIRFDDGREELYDLSVDAFEDNDLLLSLPLTIEAKAHYVFLCAALNNLIGTPLCTPPVGTQTPTDAALVVQLSPNPVTEVLNIHLLAPVTAIDLLDATGKSQRTFQAAPGTLAVPVSDLPPGVFFLRLCLADGAVATAKFVKV
jgi:arylsulfatase B